MIFGSRSGLASCDRVGQLKRVLGNRTIQGDKGGSKEMESDKGGSDRDYDAIDQFKAAKHKHDER